MMDERKELLGKELGIQALSRALYAWSFFAIGVMAVVAFLLGNDAGQVVAEINSDPAGVTALMYELLSSVSVFSAPFDLYALLSFALTVYSAYRVFMGAELLKKPYRAAARVGGAVGLIGSLLATSGYALLFLLSFTPKSAGGLSATSLGPLVLLPLPLPWPMAIGLPLWCIGMAMDATVLGFAFRSEKNGRAESLSFALAIGLALLIIPMLGMIIALIASSKLGGMKG